MHISVRGEGRDGKRLNPREEDLRRWREIFAERLRGWGIEAEASSQAVRGSRHRFERVWSRKKLPRQGFAGAGLRPPLTRCTARNPSLAVNDGLRRAWRSTVRGRTIAK